MAKKIHIIKQENDVAEKALQLRPSDPVNPGDNQLWINLNDDSINILKNGNKVILNKANISEVIILNLENINTKSFTVDGNIKEPSLTKIYPDGGPVQFYNLDFIVIQPNTIIWENLGLDGILENGDKIIIEYF